MKQQFVLANDKTNLLYQFNVPRDKNKQVINTHI